MVHVSPTGEYRFPASTDAPVPEGFQKREITTLREADQVCREVNAREDATLREVQQHSEHQRQLTRQRNRAFLDGIRDKMTPAGRLFMDRAREYSALRDRERANSRPRSANFHMEVFSMDSSNREAHCDERTGWRSRKG